MATCTVLPELATVFVLMTVDAAGSQCEERSRGILNLELPQLIEVDVFELMAVPALLLGVCPNELIACLIVIERRLAVRPVDKLKLAPDVIPMARGTVATLLDNLNNLGVIAKIRRDPLCNLGMAVQAFENRLPRPKGMALRATKRTIKTAMSVGEIAGRQLPPEQGCQPQQQQGHNNGAR